MKRKRKILLISILVILFVFFISNIIIFYQYNHVNYKYYWNRLLNKTETHSLNEQFVLETGVLAKLENTGFSGMFVDNFQKDLAGNDSESYVHCKGDCNDDYFIYINDRRVESKFERLRYPYLFSAYMSTDKNENGERTFIFKKTGL